jgi:hypothetical protein
MEKSEKNLKIMFFEIWPLENQRKPHVFTHFENKFARKIKSTDSLSAQTKSG